jgi:hypothetical protein
MLDTDCKVHLSLDFSSLIFLQVSLNGIWIIVKINHER